MTTRKEIGKKIQNYRQRQNIPIQEFADALGVDTSLFKLIESGNEHIPFILIEKIAKKLEIQL